MHALDEPSTLNRFFDREIGPIRLPHAPKAERRRDLRAAEGIVFGVVTGAAILSWTWAIAEQIARAW